MTKNWKPKEEYTDLIARSVEFISDELAEMQQAIGCPNSFIVELTNELISPYKSNTKVIRRDED